MFMQTPAPQPTDLQSFLTTIAAVSVAVERVVEILKQTIGTVPIIKWVFTNNTDAKQNSWRCAVIHLLSAGIGGAIAACSKITLNFVHAFGSCTGPKCIAVFTYVLIGLLSAGGSAFWNHALDLVKASKVQKEQTAKMAVATTSGIASASAVNL
jgi:hypothetical protein